MQTNVVDKLHNSAQSPNHQSALQQRRQSTRLSTTSTTKYIFNLYIVHSFLLMHKYIIVRLIQSLKERNVHRYSTVLGVKP